MIQYTLFLNLIKQYFNIHEIFKITIINYDKIHQQLKNLIIV